ncbi:MAG: cell division protein FtsL [Pseudomonadota bacterium]
MSGAKQQGAIVPRMAGITLALAALAALCMAAAAVVYTKHQSRQLFIELQDLSKQRDALNTEWGRLQLEQSTYAAHSLIEDKAMDSLALSRPQTGEVFLINDDGDYRFVGLEPMSEELASLLGEPVQVVSQ